jgi:hypothetical protein
MVYQSSVMKEQATGTRTRWLRHVTFQSHRRTARYDFGSGVKFRDLPDPCTLLGLADCAFAASQNRALAQPNLT